MDFNLFLKHLERNKLQALAIIIAFAMLGVIYIIFTPKSYRAETLLLPESKSSSSLGGLGQIASSIPGLGSFSLGASGSDAIRPSLYPSIVQSTPFVREFVDYTFYHPDFKDSVNLMSYGQNYAPTNPWSVLKKYTIGLPGEIISAVRNIGNEEENPPSTIFDKVKKENGFYRPTVGDFKYLNAIKDVVSVTVDKSTGIIRVSVQTTNPVLSAYLTEFTKNYLVSYVTKYRQDKQIQQVDFLTARNKELEQKFLEDQSRLASFKEKNLDIRSPYLQNQLENLSSQYELSKSLYFTVNSQLEQAKIKLNEETPIFAEIEPVSIPAIKSKPQTMLVLFLMGSLGVLTAALFVLIKIPKQK
ncbi:Wzz/FepE/Etk N-terminal domain-containing protein [Algoriphagus formosus]|uniref:Polysaccharide chain length determinant N-terminal domain-containing protein n=1 Tax=Algoriphagus formosus TaxID=2007308 RepID=A0A4R5V5V3_9BACT|nr:Wzz/FepE/Etk N-terminal domain-containing protein [Algoriphagus aquimaris]TDK47319.1 hypothetical protein E1898_05495 [Algoriphagus aquimaris]